MSRAWRSILLAVALVAALAGPARAAGGGGLIVFGSDASGNSELWTVRPDGTGLMQLTRSPPGSHQWMPAWSPDGTKILFDSDAGGYQSRLFVMNADGSNARPLGAVSPALEAFWPEFALDSSRITFTAYCCKPVTRQVWVVHPNGVVTELTGPSAQVTNAMASPSPDGSKLVYESDAGHPGQWDLWTMNADGSGQTEITTGPISTFDDPFPNWGP